MIAIIANININNIINNVSFFASYNALFYYNVRKCFLDNEFNRN